MRRVSGTTDARAQLISVDGWRLSEDRIEPDPWSWVYRQRPVAIRPVFLAALLILLALPTLAAAQPPVVPWADWASYGTAAVNPAIALVTALRSESRGCHLLRLGLSELVGNGATLTLKHVIRSPRPCLGCPPDGMPSGHTMNSLIGVSARGATAYGWQLGVTVSLGTGILRDAAHRHTPWQILAGAAIGAGAEAAGQLVRCDP